MLAGRHLPGCLEAMTHRGCMEAGPGFLFFLVGFSGPICLDLWWDHGSEMSGCQIRLTDDAHNNDYQMGFFANRKKFTNWTNRDDEKLLDILIEETVQGSIKFKCGLVRVILKNEGVNKEGSQIKNRYNDLGKKLRAWEFLMSKKGAEIYGKYKSFRKKVPANLEKMKSAFYRKHTIGEMSFAPGMVVSPSNQTQQSKGRAIDIEEHVGDSDEANEDDFGADVKCLGVEEKCTQLSQAKKDEEVHQALTILRMREELRRQPSLIKQEHPYHRIGFHMDVMDYIEKHKEEKFFMDLDDGFVVKYDYTMDEEDCTMDEEEDHAIDTIFVYTLERFHME
ncbi:hypothetical protein Cgig2_001563 [Carnegiea gigantea]|uniref:Uncharacterized protein n=1 Tax=Carnegiea gigantea TaxID=171969 RepID=A0A9Q1JVV9_9CARY|nr:hypothetical protein Cgig2_001563 [Carnegiea gigantea]